MISWWFILAIGLSMVNYSAPSATPMVSSSTSLPTGMEKRMLLVPPGDLLDSASNSLNEQRSNNDHIQLPVALLATIDVDDNDRSTNDTDEEELTLTNELVPDSNKTISSQQIVGGTDSANDTLVERPVKTNLTSVWKMILNFIHNLTKSYKRQQEAQTRDQRRDDEDAVITPSVKDIVTRIVGAAMGEQDCRRHAACRAGRYMQLFRGKNLVLLILDKWAPNTWMDTLKVTKNAATYGDDCNIFICKLPNSDH